MVTDYTKYDAKELLEALSGINASLYPENYSVLTAEISSRRDEIDEYYRIEAEYKNKKWGRVLSGLGIMQVITAVSMIVMLVLSITNTSILVILITVLVILLNATAGITLFKRNTRFYYLSYLNQGLQVVSFGIGSLYYNYYGLGGVYLMIDWVSDAYNWFSASFNLGGAVFEYSSLYNLGFIQIDVLAIFFMWVISQSILKSTNVQKANKFSSLQLE